MSDSEHKLQVTWIATDLVKPEPYKCPCGNGTLEPTHDLKLGHRLALCDNCKKPWAILNDGRPFCPMYAETS